MAATIFTIVFTITFAFTAMTVLAGHWKQDGSLAEANALPPLEGRRLRLAQACQRLRDENLERARRGLPLIPISREGLEALAQLELED